MVGPLCRGEVRCDVVGVCCDVGVRRSTVFGVALAAERDGSSCKPDLESDMEVLLALVAKTGAREVLRRISPNS